MGVESSVKKLQTSSRITIEIEALPKGAELSCAELTVHAPNCLELYSVTVTITVSRLGKLCKLLLPMSLHPNVQFLFECGQACCGYYFLW